VQASARRAKIDCAKGQVNTVMPIGTQSKVPRDGSGLGCDGHSQLRGGAGGGMRELSFEAVGGQPGDGTRGRASS
jgi:hypothetical protein